MFAVSEHDFLNLRCTSTRGKLLSILWQLLLTTRGYGGVLAYDAASTAPARPLWRVMGVPRVRREVNAWEVAASPDGYVFVCDYDNACVHVFTADSAYMGVAVTQGDQVRLPVLSSDLRVDKTYFGFSDFDACHVVRVLCSSVSF